MVQDLVTLQQQGRSLVVVHGGGNMITQWLKRQGAETRFVHGERVTDGTTLEVATAVLAGIANKQIVSAICLAGGRAMGLSGVDGALIQGRVKDPGLGYVGEVAKVDNTILENLVNQGFIAVVSPISLNLDGGYGEVTGLLNINGDIVAGEIAAAVMAERLIFLTDVPGISDGAGNYLAELPSREAEALVDSGVASGGMVPKIRACLKAVSVGTVARIIDGSQPHALLNEVEGRGGGTTIGK
jgi:acetylglutamate kinase